MSDGRDSPLLHRAEVPIDGLTVAELRERAESSGLDPDRPEVRALLSLQQPEATWVASVTFEVRPDGAVPVAVELRSTTGQAVSRKAWDSIKVATVIAEARTSAEWLAPATGRTAPAELAEPVRTGRRGRPPTYSDEHYRRVARVYLAAVAAGERPLRAVARAFEGEYPGLADSGDNRVKSWAVACRARGLLPTRAENEK